MSHKDSYVFYKHSKSPISHDESEASSLSEILMTVMMEDTPLEVITCENRTQGCQVEHCKSPH